jgi:hypothetical protein
MGKPAQARHHLSGRLGRRLPTGPVDAIPQLEAPQPRGVKLLDATIASAAATNASLDITIANSICHRAGPAERDFCATQLPVGLSTQFPNAPNCGALPQQNLDGSPGVQIRQREFQLQRNTDWPRRSVGGGVTS